MKSLALFIVCCIPSFAFSWKYDNNVTLKALGPIHVMIVDNAISGCWTNLNEVKNYASDKIKLLGGDLTDDRENAIINGVILTISVQAARNNKIGGICYGRVSVSVETLARSEAKPNVLGVIQYSQFNYVASMPTNFNNVALDTVKQAIVEWEKGE